MLPSNPHVRRGRAGAEGTGARGVLAPKADSEPNPSSTAPGRAAQARIGIAAALPPRRDLSNHAKIHALSMYHRGCCRRRGSGASSLCTDAHRWGTKLSSFASGSSPEGEAHTYVWGLILFVVAFNFVCFDLTRDAAAADDDELRAAVADALLPDRTTRP